jgi:class 3 adenylate cyclase/tetratricopeptide (TPR) repeat protein
MICYACGSPLEYETNRCRHCDGPEAEPRVELGPTSRRSRRTYAVVLFADLAGYTALGELIDPEQLADVMHRVKSTAAAVVQGHGGTINQFAGDGILIVFGVPQAREDDALRAVTAAQQLHEAVQALDPRDGPIGVRQLRLHAGIAIGTVIAESGDARAGVYSLTGDAVNTAARLCAAAPAGATFISEAVREAVTPFFNVEALEPLGLKGKARPVASYRVVGRSAARSRFDGSQERGLSPFVGRNAELALLCDAFARAASGQGALLTLSGHAGAGKTRLLHELRRELSQRRLPDARVLHGGCDASSRVPYHPFVQILRQVVDEAGVPDGSSNGPAAAAALRAVSTSLEPHLWRLLSLLSLRDPSLPAPGELSVEALGAVTIEALLALLGELARRKPLLLLLEDWHWADEASSVVLRSLARSVGRWAVFTVVDYRPSPDDTLLSLGSVHLQLEPLDREDTGRLSRSLAGASALLEDSVAVIHERTGGNPLFIEEVFRSLRHQRNAEGSPFDSGALGPLTIPASVHAVLRSRVDDLAAEERRVLQVAAVLGVEFELPMLAQLAPAVGDPAARLHRLQGLELVDRAGRGAAARYRFKHAITQEVVYDTLLRADLRELHGNAGKLLEAAAVPDQIEGCCELLAHHYARSEDLERAALYCEQAGDKAARAQSLEQVRVHYGEAIRCLDALPPTPERLARRVDITLRWGAACIFKPERRQVAVLQAAHHVAARVGDQGAVARCLYFAGWIQYALGNQEEAVREFTRAMPIAVDQRDERLVAQLSFNLGQSYAAATEYGAALEHLSRGLEAPRAPSGAGTGSARPATRAQPRLIGGHAYALGYLALIRGDIGEFDAAYAHAHAALQRLRDAGGSVVEGSLLTQLAMVQTMQGDWSGALDTAATMRRMGERIHGPYIFAMSKTVSGAARFHLGQQGLGIAELEQAAGWLQEHEVKLTLSWNLAVLAEALALKGEAEPASRYAARALERATSWDRLGEVTAHRALGIAKALRSEQLDAARASFAEALRLARAKGSPRDSAITELRFGEVLARRGDRAEAERLLRQALAAFETMNMSSYAARVAVALQSLADR